MDDQKVEQDPVSVLTLAEKIYSDMIAEGEMRRAALIAEGDSYREDKVANSGEEVRLITERLESLRDFEKAYRASLREFANNILDFLKEPESEEAEKTDSLDEISQENNSEDILES